MSLVTRHQPTFNQPPPPEVATCATQGLPRSRSTSARWVALLLLAVSFAAQGCIHRRLMIRSDPPGAMVLVEGEEIGPTPIAIDFTYYGTREFTLIKDGYETLTVLQKVKTPWYELFPLEFVTDNFSLMKINDRHDFTYRMRPQVIVPTQELLDRAQGLRTEAEIPQ